jgi:hypothetical protein
MVTSRCLVALLLLAIAGCSASPAQTMAHQAPLVVGALTAHRLGCTEVDAYSASCVGD